jgi:ribokinase
MTAVVSLGSINVDRIQYLTTDRIRALERQYDWFPSEGETVRVQDVPAAAAVEEAEHFIGGKGANQAVAAANLASEVMLLGSVGQDESDYSVISTLESRGVSVDAISESSRETGKAYVFVDESGESWIAIVGGANTAIDEHYFDNHYDAIRDADALLVQNEISVEPVESLLNQLADEPSRPTVICNPSPANGAIPLLRADAVDVLVVNESEYDALATECRRFDGTLLKTRGGDSVLVEGEETFQVTPPDAEPVDTTGAGDVFCGYLAAHLGAGHSVRHAVEDATVAASRSTEVEGAQEAISNLEANRQHVGR